MRYTRLISLALAVLAIAPALAVAVRGEDYDAQDRLTEKLSQELREIDTTPKPGDEVVTLRDTALKVGAETVATATKGAKLTIEQVRRPWLWVHTEQTRGWVMGTDVIIGQLMAWYNRLPDNESVADGENVRAKFAGTMFELLTAGPEQSNTYGIDASDYGVRAGYFIVDAAYSNLRIGLERRKGTNRTLRVKFDPAPSDFLYPYQLPAPAGWAYGKRYGIIQPGDYVSIDTRSRQVYVNGQLRRPQ